MTIRNLRLVLLLVIVSAILCAGALFNARKLGGLAHLNGDYKAARWWYQIAAVTGNQDAQNNLAGLYAAGLGGERNDTLAVKWYQRAVDQRKWYQRAATQGGASQARFNLSNFYEEGRGVPRDTKKAAALLESAAADGDVDAAFNLGSLYATGRDDFPKDTAKGMAWYKKAADRGFASAQYNLGALYAQGVDTPKEYAQAGIWFTKAARQGHAKAQLDLGTMYSFGLGYEADVTQGIQWLRKAAVQPATSVEARKRLEGLCKRAITPADILLCQNP